MNISLFIFASFLLQMICFWVGKKSSKEIKSQDDYYLAGKDVKFFPLMMTFLATQVGGGLILGSAEEAYRYGWFVLFFPLGSALGLFLLAAGIGKKMARFKVSTVAQLFEVIYGSIPLKKFASLLSITSLFMIFVAQIIASKKFMISIGVDNEALFAVFWAIVIIYTVMGGFKAVVATDIVQASFFMTVFIFCFGFIYYEMTPSFNAIQALSYEDFDYTKLFSWLLMPLLFMVIEQDMAQRCFAAKTPQVVARSAGFAAALTCLICLIPVSLGILAKQLGVDIPSGGSVLISVIQQVTSPALSALVGCAILAAIISTADSLINAISSNLSQDFDLRFLRQYHPVKVGQSLTAVIALLGIILAPFFNNVVELLVLSYELCVVCLFVPIFFGILRKRKGHYISAYSSIAGGIAGLILFNQVETAWLPKEIWSVLLSLSGYFSAELYLKINQKHPQATLPLS